ncbi:hypothetical protein [Aliidiomarina sanyensis]|uniref:Uncharacterized protein n=1 Tax=Aliidiomarina sanyensis TaxID=1249555 RepID=A0A432WER9_9GAMM|nr:hypothetical protein [Aliidiomarina sanyensis]RUO31393.1 hypothetical protein CWE11_08635 [Aliidiomarina sanyensis]
MKTSGPLEAAITAALFAAAVSFAVWQFSPSAKFEDESIPTAVMDGSALVSDTSCRLQLQLIAPLHRREHFIERLSYVQEQFAHGGLSICATHFPADDIAQCNGSSRRVECDLDWSALPEPVEGMHTVTLVASGRGVANTRNGIVFVPEQASGLLLQHEIGHALGLADEYPMRARLAEAFCSGSFSFQPLNLVLTSSDVMTYEEKQMLRNRIPWIAHLEAPIATERDDGLWTLGTPEAYEEQIGLFPAATCDATATFAWKPLAEVTFMEHHELGSVPDLYLKLIDERLE